MTTQGLVTIQQGGRVLMKIVTGSDRMNAQKVADYVETHWLMTVSKAHQAALDCGFGHEESLVVISRDSICEVDSLDRAEFCLNVSLYASTFDNPRWELGAAEFTVIVNIPLMVGRGVELIVFNIFVCEKQSLIKEN